MGTCLWLTFLNYYLKPPTSFSIWQSPYKIWIFTIDQVKIKIFAKNNFWHGFNNLYRGVYSIIKVWTIQRSSGYTCSQTLWPAATACKRERKTYSLVPRNVGEMCSQRRRNDKLGAHNMGFSLISNNRISHILEWFFYLDWRIFCKSDYCFSL